MLLKDADGMANIINPDQTAPVSQNNCDHYGRAYHINLFVSICHRGAKNTWPNRDSNPGPLAYCASTLTTEPPSNRSTSDNFPLLNKIRPRILSEPCRPEPMRQSLCCSQPEHGPTLSHQILLGRKKHMARPGLKPRTSRIPCQHSWPLSHTVDLGSECSHSMRKVLGSQSRSGHVLFPPLWHILYFFQQ